MAVVVLVAMVAVLYMGVSALFEKGGTDSIAPSVPPTIVTVPSTGVSPNPTSSPSTTTTTLPGPKPITVPTAADPAELLIMGDSDAGTFGPYLKRLLDSTGIVTTQLDYKTSSGLARPDFFDWPVHMLNAVPQANPDIVVVTFGGNDAQGLRTGDKKWVVPNPPGGGGDDSAWREEYGKRVSGVMDFLASGNRTLIWVGIPNDNNPDVTARLAVQNDVVREQVAAHPGVVFIDTWARFSGVNGGWAEYVVDPRDNVGKDVRAADGFHLNENGAEILALDVYSAVLQALKVRGAAI